MQFRKILKQNLLFPVSQQWIHFLYTNTFFASVHYTLMETKVFSGQECKTY